MSLSIAINAGGGPLPMAAIMGSLVEDVFSRLVPCQANATTVRQYKDTHLDDLHLMYQNRIWRLEENPNLSNNQKNKVIDEVKREWEDKRFVIENDDLNITSKMVAQIANYDRAKKDYEEKCSKCLTLFLERLGPGPLSQVKDELMQHTSVQSGSPCTSDTIQVLAESRTLSTCCASFKPVPGTAPSPLRLSSSSP
jgi:hypothetical protein